MQESYSAHLHARLSALHRRLRHSILQQTRTTSFADMSEVVAEQGGDVIFAIDKVSEAQLPDFCEKELFPEIEFVLIAEGLPGNGEKLFSKSSHADSVPYRLIIDPIDGTRPLMYDKRSAWILSGLAHNRGEQTGLKDIFLAIQTEIPVLKQNSADQLWAIRGQHAQALRENVDSGASQPYHPSPSQAASLDQGFASFVHFFHGNKRLISEIDERLRELVHGTLAPNKAWTFEDQYMSTGGQIYELSTGRDRFIADLRALAGGMLDALSGLCCHPYDLCTSLIAEAAGAIVTGSDSQPLNAPLSVHENVDWIGYANQTIYSQIQPALQEILHQVASERTGS